MMALRWLMGNGASGRPMDLAQERVEEEFSSEQEIAIIQGELLVSLEIY